LGTLKAFYGTRGGQLGFLEIRSIKIWDKFLWRKRRM